MALKILVCGSRNWTDREIITAALAEIMEPWPISVDEPTIIHGDAKGADSIAAEIALELGFWVEAHPADWKQYGRLAGPKRNLEMLDREPDLVLAFQVGQSRGTQHTINHARKRGIPVKVYHE